MIIDHPWFSELLRKLRRTRLGGGLDLDYPSSPETYSLLEAQKRENQGEGQEGDGIHSGKKYPRLRACLPVAPTWTGSWSSAWTPRSRRDPIQPSHHPLASLPFNPLMTRDPSANKQQICIHPYDRSVNNHRNMVLK